MEIKERQLTNSPTESTLDPPYGEIQEILVLFEIDNYRERYHNAINKKASGSKPPIFSTSPIWGKCVLCSFSFLLSVVLT